MPQVGRMGASRPFPLVGGPEPGRRRELTLRCQVPVARTPGGAAAVLKGPAVKVAGSLWSRVEWAPGGKQTLNFQLGLDLPGGVWRVCKGAAEALRAFGWVNKGTWGCREAQGPRGSSWRLPAGHKGVFEGWAQQTGRSGYLDCPGTSALDSGLVDGSLSFTIWETRDWESQLRSDRYSLEQLFFSF